ncbi:hypothetical protein TNCV_5007021 [Trichonephila clavipes]|nr:hypothetical protein TNCV_5007021 [Trichonephila clavipes]
MPPELAAPSNFHTTQTGGLFSPDSLMCFGSSTRRAFSSTRLELMTRWLRVRDLDHLATLATLKFNILKDNEGQRKQHSRSFMARRESRVLTPPQS